MLVGFGESQAAWQPKEDVVVQGAALLKLGNPHVTQGVAATTHPDADALQQVADVLGIPLPDLSIGQGQHDHGIGPKAPPLLRVGSGCEPDTAPEARQPPTVFSWNEPAYSVPELI